MTSAAAVAVVTVSCSSSSGSSLEASRSASLCRPSNLPGWSATGRRPVTSEERAPAWAVRQPDSYVPVTELVIALPLYRQPSLIRARLRSSIRAFNSLYSTLTNLGPFPRKARTRATHYRPRSHPRCASRRFASTDSDSRPSPLKGCQFFFAALSLLSRKSDGDKPVPTMRWVVT